MGAVKGLSEVGYLAGWGCGTCIARFFAPLSGSGTWVSASGASQSGVFVEGFCAFCAQTLPPRSSGVGSREASLVHVHGSN